MVSSKEESLAGIEYHGLAGVSQACKEAVIRIIQFQDDIKFVRILTCDGSHCLLLTLEAGDLVAIKSGFASGYGGEGPRALSYVLQLLDAHGVEVDETSVNEELINRLDASALRKADIKAIEAARPIRPTRWRDYVFQEDWARRHAGEYWAECRPVIPFAILDPRIADLAVHFWDKPDDALLVGYRRLEDIVRARTQLDEHGGKLFSQAFLGEGARLYWKDLEDRAQQGRGSLFTSTYLAYRNPRAHRELNVNAYGALAEFLLLNQLYHLERDAQERLPENPPNDPAASGVTEGP
jgi:hypothetical protein